MKECIMACEETHISDIPTYVQDLVRCKDCKYYDGNGTCMKNGIALLTDNWFCADGEPKEGAEEDG